jgi:hypothetical protein
MAALATQNLGAAGGAYTIAAAAGGGDTAETGYGAGGWSSPTFLVGTVGATPTTITIAGVAYGPFTTQNVVLPLSGAAGATGGRVNITYNQVTSVSVGVVRTGGALTGVTFGT